MTTPKLAADARNRAWRTLLQGFAYTVAAAIIVGLLSAVTTVTSWSELGGVLVGFSFFQAIAVAGLSWLMRAVLDPSEKVPTPLPPADPGEPDDDTTTGRHAGFDPTDHDA